jgi:hypothetical protein
VILYLHRVRSPVLDFVVKTYACRRCLSRSSHRRFGEKRGSSCKIDRYWRPGNRLPFAILRESWVLRAGHIVGSASLKTNITHLSAYHATSSFLSSNPAPARSGTSHAQFLRSKDTRVTILLSGKCSRRHILDRKSPISTCTRMFGE